MRGKIILIGLLMIGSIAANIMAEEIKLQPIDFSHPAVKAVIARQESMASGRLEFLWDTTSKKTQELFGPDGFRELYGSPGGKNRVSLISKAELSGIKVINDNRVWIEASARPLASFKGAYFVKEEGLWKFASIDRYLKKVSADLDSLSNSISDYYQKNKKLPQSLSELSTDIPIDLFSDNNAPYQYKVITKSTCIVYSLGPDSRDDFGLVEYSRKDHPISSGDIIKKAVVQ